MKATMRFFRQGGIYRSDGIANTWGPRPPPAGRSRSPVKRRDRSNKTPRSSSATSSGQLFLDRVARLLASIARLRFTGKLILKPFRDGAQ